MKLSANKVLVDSAVGENVSQIAQELAEMALDLNLDDELLEKIPFVSLLVKTLAVGRGIRDRIFLKKIALFLREAGKISSADRTAFSRRLAKEPGLAETCGEAALLLLDKLSQANKARLMGYAFRRFLQGAIDDVILHRIYAALEFLPLWQLIQLPEYYFERGLGSLSQSDATSYQQLWFIDIYYGDKDKRFHFDPDTGQSFFMIYHQPFYRPTPVGSRVAEVVRDYLAEPD